ncbi:MAG: SDR family oxidoreductase [Pseudomonadota bacterium]
MKVAGKTVAITGGAHGIGLALAERFAHEGATAVAVLDLDGPAAEAAAQRIGEAADGVATLGLAVDVGDEAALHDAVSRIEGALGPIDLFCSNAGVAYTDGDGGLAVSASNDAWAGCWSVNVMAHVYAARAVLPGMIERGSGWLLNTVSAAGLLNQIGDAAYSTTKHAAIGLAESLAISHGDDGIGVSVLCPQYVATRMIDAFDDAGMIEMDGVLQPADVADAVVEALADERFLILPHAQVASYMQLKAGDYERWLGGMRKLRRKFAHVLPGRKKT